MPKQPLIYLDNNATTRLDNRVYEAMFPYFMENYSNAASSHLSGMIINEAVENSRESVAALIGAKHNEIIFTSGATESINLAIKGLAQQDRKHIVTVSTEHRAVLDTCQYMETIGFTVTYLPVTNDGFVSLDQLRDVVTTNTLLVCVMHANNETGVIQPIKEIAAIAHSEGALFMTDVTQTVGKVPIDVESLGVDMLSLSAHKFYGPKGIGALYVGSRSRTKLSPQLHGGGHQRGMRSGTLNVPGIIALGKACDIAVEDMDKDNIRIGTLLKKLESELLKIKDSFVNGTDDGRLYNTTNISFPGIISEKVILALQNIAVSNGSACTALSTEPSYVLTAMGLTDSDALSSIRFSLGRFTTRQDIDIAIPRITELIEIFRPS